LAYVKCSQPKMVTKDRQAQPDMLGDLTHVVRLNWQDWAGHSSYVVK